MDDLKKLLENAGVAESGQWRGDVTDDNEVPHFSELLNDFSDEYFFKVYEDGSIDIFDTAADIHKPGLDTNEVLIGSFDSFDVMLETGLGN